MLRRKNESLDKSIGKQEKELQQLKHLFLAQAQLKFEQAPGCVIKKLLESDDDDGNGAGASQSSKTK